MNFITLIIVLSTFCFAKPVLINTQDELKRLTLLYDRDKDQKLTVDDKLPSDATYELKHQGGEFTVQGLYHLSNLLQELSWAGKRKAPLELALVQENPIDRISRLIKTQYWDGLTRSINKDTLRRVIADEKFPTNPKYLYVPHNDIESYNFFSKLNEPGIKVIRLPEQESAFDSVVGDRHGLLTLAAQNGVGVPYVVPGGRFNEMYGWDSYFHVLGTIQDGRLDLAKAMTDNFIYEIENYGKILNANRTYYLSRSQPPFFTSMVREVYRRMAKNKQSKEWLKRAILAAIREYEAVWMGQDRLTEIGLSRYAGFHPGIPPEVEPGHFDEFLKPFAKRYKISIEALVKKVNSQEIKDPKITAFFNQDRAVRESGHDTTYRWRVGTVDRASDFVTVDLNSLLYKYELDLALLIHDEFSGSVAGHTHQKFQKAAEKRKVLIRKYLWDSKMGLFFDYNFVLKRPSRYLSATTLYPLWATHDHDRKLDLLTASEAQRLTTSSLKELEQTGGLSATSESSLKSVDGRIEERQWDYPNGWAPHQIMAWTGLRHYGLDGHANRLIYKWLYMITKNAMDYNGTIPEKYNVVTRSHKVFAEYGNVGTKFAYITTEGFGWMNASYQVGLSQLPGKLLQELKKMSPPESISP